MDITFLPKDRPLRRDVNTLGHILGDILKKLGGASLFDRVEACRQAARRRRRGSAEAERRLQDLLTGLSSTEANEVVRAFSAYFELVNMAERVHRIRRRRDYLRQGVRQRGSFAAVLEALKEEGVEASELHDLLTRLSITPVFTAHPTEATRRTLLTKEQRIARALVDRIHEDGLTPHENRAALARVASEVSIAWHTEEHPPQPSVMDEVEHVAFFLTDVVYRIVPAIYDYLEEAIRATYGEEALSGRIPTFIHFASWVGGDMDGNPHVGPGTIRETLARHRELVLELYQREVRRLFDYLSHSDSRIRVTDEVSSRIAHYRRLLPEVDASIPERYRGMPYRVLLWLMSSRLEQASRGEERGYPGPAELVEDLHRILSSLASHQGSGGARVDRLLRRVETFGFHLVTLDVRQDALVHRDAVGEALGRSDFGKLPPNERRRLLESALQQGPTPQASSSPSAGNDAPFERCLSVMQAIGDGRSRYGDDAVGPYIISMASGPDDALAVLYLARLAGLVDARGVVPLDVAPLFETVGDLQEADRTIGELLADPSYRRHLHGRGERQIVMVGYSDSNKESGIAASRWALYGAQERLVAALQSSGVELALFHGRGGTISRGGGKPRQGILAEPQGAVNGHLRFTEQGEIIAMKYGLRDLALRTIELTAGAVLERTAREVENGRGDAVDSQWRRAVASLAETSRGSYQTLIRETPSFLDYFRAATPIDIIERLPMGSRPPSRRSGSGLENLRAIPWVFAWTQSRHLLPGWYGMGTGLEAMREAYGLEALREMAARWPFFANLVGDVEMVLAKADMPIASHYAELAAEVGERVFPVLQEEFERARRLICEIQDVDDLLDREPVLKRSILLRNPYVDPMSLLQVDLLRRWRAGGRRNEELERALLTTVRGIARGMQNTG